MAAQYFFWCGVALNLVGTFIALGFLGVYGCEWWVRFRDIRGPLLRFHAAELRKARDEKEAREWGDAG